MDRPNKPGRKPSRVEVIYFPRAKPKPVLVQPAALDPSTMPTLPGISLGGDDMATEPAFFPDLTELNRVARKTTPGAALPARASSKAGPKKRRARTPEAVSALPTRQTYREFLARLKAPRLSKAALERLTDVLSRFGHEMFEAGKRETAREVFEALVRSGVRDAFVHTMLGTIWLASADVSKAAAQFESALRISPEYVPALVYRGELGLRRGSLRSGLADLKRAVALGHPNDPFFARARKLLAVASRLKRPKGDR